MAPSCSVLRVVSETQKLKHEQPRRGIRWFVDSIRIVSSEIARWIRMVIGLSRRLRSRTMRGDARFPTIVPREWHFPFSNAAGYLRRQLLLDQNGSLGHPNPLRRGARLPIVAIDLEGVEIRGASQRFPVSTLLFSFLAAQPCSVTISRWSAAGRFALVSRFDGKAERRPVAENMLKIERQAV